MSADRVCRLPQSVRSERKRGGREGMEWVTRDAREDEEDRETWKRDGEELYFGRNQFFMVTATMIIFSNSQGITGNLGQTLEHKVENYSRLLTSLKAVCYIDFSQ
ncbi:unnamed protein product [Triticum turgidum subsp. durum]|uniref:Uncharacterized protein n=1 Tax=Triticum turgidum subsp. durum TaxID=4567 RepID=A0A9R0UTT4_TRITD|nr:unnamed protein product [Triticum turgidum subsp. durum]